MGTNRVTIEVEPFKVIHVNILTVEERNVVECLVVSVQNRVGNQEGNVDARHEIQEDNVGATQGSEEDMLTYV